MKKLFAALTVCIIALTSSLSVYAANGEVTYSGNAGNFVFAPGSDYSLTDLFPNFKDVMPGDTLTQRITVRNDASSNVKVKIYIRSLGAQKDSEAFLSQLSLQVKKSADNSMAYMFDAAASESAGLSDWVYLGMLYSGGEVNLDVTLQVPIELDNEFQNAVGYLDWEFKVEEYPKEADDPIAPPTGDHFQGGLWSTLLICSFAMIIILFVWRKKAKKAA